MIQRTTSYILASAKGYYIAQDEDKHLYKTTDLDNAYRWKTEKAANNVIKNCGNKEFREEFVTLEIVDEEEIDDARLEENEKKQLIEMLLSPYKPSGDDAPFTLDELTQRYQMVEISIKLLADVLKDRDKIFDELDKAEGKWLDIEHYIEFKELSAVDGYKAYKMLHDIRLLRRALKNMTVMYDILDRHDISFDKLYNMIDNMGKFNSRDYKPRQVPTLFDERNII